MEKLEAQARHRIISELGICPDCEAPLVASQDIRWPHEDCLACGTRFLADSFPGYRRLIEAHPLPGEIGRRLFIEVIYDEERGKVDA